MLLRFTSCALNGPPLGIQDQSQSHVLQGTKIASATDTWQIRHELSKEGRQQEPNAGYVECCTGNVLEEAAWDAQQWTGQANSGSFFE